MALNEGTKVGKYRIVGVGGLDLGQEDAGKVDTVEGLEAKRYGWEAEMSCEIQFLLQHQLMVTSNAGVQ